MRVAHDAAARTVIVHRGAHVAVVNLSPEPRTLVVPGGLRVALAWDARETVLDGARIALAAQTAAVLGPAV